MRGALVERSAPCSPHSATERSAIGASRRAASWSETPGRPVRGAASGQHLQRPLGDATRGRLVRQEPRGLPLNVAPSAGGRRPG
jgi:hypothetical protein